ncbi:hypothetical protein AVEN_157753-1 [Araneus ventricosus]|uniref:Uncharacterized protein n=1 Tax=Araneus ventricosus TaxID=182803 RepID=A0A4Y2JGR9_ARAVE|nr:hypothetical protein AVEN_157753-1 [Araneus ventricosus]
MPFVPRPDFPSTDSSRKIRHIIHGCSKVCFDTPCLEGSKSQSYTLPHSSDKADFRFYFQRDLASSRGPNLGRTFVLPLSSQHGPRKAIRPFQFDFKLFGIPTLPIRYASFHQSLILTKGFSSPCSKNRRVEQR